MMRLLARTHLHHGKLLCEVHLSRRRGAETQAVHGVLHARRLQAGSNPLVRIRDKPAGQHALHTFLRVPKQIGQRSVPSRVKQACLPGSQSASQRGLCPAWAMRACLLYERHERAL